MFWQEWVRLSYHCPMSWQEYLGLSRVSRFQLQRELTKWVRAMNGDVDGNDSVPTTATPRTIRRTGLY